MGLLAGTGTMEEKWPLHRSCPNWRRWGEIPLSFFFHSPGSRYHPLLVKASWFRGLEIASGRSDPGEGKRMDLRSKQALAGRAFMYETTSCDILTSMVWSLYSSEDESCLEDDSPAPQSKWGVFHVLSSVWRRTVVDTTMPRPDPPLGMKELFPHCWECCGRWPTASLNYPQFKEPPCLKLPPFLGAAHIQWWINMEKVWPFMPAWDHWERASQLWNSLLGYLRPFPPSALPSPLPLPSSSVGDNPRAPLNYFSAQVIPNLHTQRISNILSKFGKTHSDKFRW